jgi:flagellar biogenesis protein FliO
MVRWVISLLQGKRSLIQERKLRISDTVSLGEKRFVAILHAEGRKFLIGGSSTGVSLLTALDTTPETTAFLDSQTEPGERIQ